MDHLIFSTKAKAACFVTYGLSCDDSAHVRWGREVVIKTSLAFVALSGLTFSSAIRKQSGYSIAFSIGQSKKLITQRLGDWSGRELRSSPFR